MLKMSLRTMRGNQNINIIVRQLNNDLNLTIKLRKADGSQRVDLNSLQVDHDE